MPNEYEPDDYALVAKSYSEWWDSLELIEQTDAWRPRPRLSTNGVLDWMQSFCVCCFEHTVGSYGASNPALLVQRGQWDVALDGWIVVMSRCLYAGESRMEALRAFTAELRLCTPTDMITAHKNTHPSRNYCEECR